MKSKISPREQERRDRQRAMSIEQFCSYYGVGKTKTYAEIRAGRLRARKCGRRTVVVEDDAEDWLRHLPSIASKGGNEAALGE
jgi:excisionase family DNA binding protein